MEFTYSERCQDYLTRVSAFMDEHVYAGEKIYEEQHQEFGPEGRWKIPPIIEELKSKAKKAKLWNMFHPDPAFGPGLSNADYAPIAELTGRCHIAPEVFNCAAPDTGNMEVLSRYGSKEQQADWLDPLLAGDIRSAFLMTEPQVASSDATNIETEINLDGDHYVINGRKWWSSGAGDPRCKIYIVMGKTDKTADRHKQQSMILVPADTPGITIERHLPVFGFDDAPHGHMEIVLDNVRVPKENIILGEGRGFEIAQGRLGPGRIHHCMRTIGAAEVALEKMVKRLLTREAFGKPLFKHSVWEQRIAEARIDLEMTRLLTLKAAWMMDHVGNRGARGEIAMIKVAAPRMALKVSLAKAYSMLRTLRLADGPDEVHCRSIARLEFKKYSNSA